MDLPSTIVVGLFTVPMLGLGLKSLLKPASMEEDLALSIQGAAGLNTVRGMVGGLFLACATLLIGGLVFEESVAFLAVAVLMAWAAIGRLLGVAVDGFDKAIVRPLVVEIVMAVALIGVHFRLESLG